MFKQIEIFEDHLVAHHPNGKRLEIYPEGAKVMEPVLDEGGRNVIEGGKLQYMEADLPEKYNRVLILESDYNALRETFDKVTKIAEVFKWTA